jgi:hypothetical protein
VDANPQIVGQGLASNLIPLSPFVLRDRLEPNRLNLGYLHVARFKVGRSLRLGAPHDVEQFESVMTLAICQLA